MRRVATAALLATITVTTAGAATLPNEYVVPGNCGYPVALAYDERTAKLFVSSQCDGAIYRGDLTSRTLRRFTEGGYPSPGGSPNVLRDPRFGLDVDARGRLYVARHEGLVVYDARNGRLLKQYMTDVRLDDVAVTSSGDVYATASAERIVFRVRTASVARGGLLSRLHPWFKFDQRAAPVLDAITATRQARYVLGINATSGELFRLDVAAKRLTKIDIGDATITIGEGMTVRDSTAYVIRSSPPEIVRVRLARNYTSGRIVGTTTHPSLDYPTAGVFARNRFLVTNSQLDVQGAPTLPFTVSSIRVP